MRKLLHRLLGYGVAVLSVGSALATNLFTAELENSRAVLFLGAVTISAWYGGLGPALFATVASTFLIDYFFLSEIHSIDLRSDALVTLGIFVFVAVLISWLTAVRRRLELALLQQNRSKSNFMAVLAHEMRNFLAPVPPVLSTLRLRGPKDETTDQCLAILERQAQGMTRLTNDLLDNARIDAGKIQLVLEPLDLGTVVVQAIEDARPLIEARGLQVDVAAPREPVHLSADRTRLEQVFANLLSNAANYSNPGGRIWVSVESRPEELIVRVQDDGKGLSADVLPHVFDRFMRADSGSSAGLGIGLSVVRGLVEMHGGSVEASSGGPGQGSEFVVRLPKLEHNGGTGEDASSRSLQMGREPASRRRKPSPRRVRVK